MNLGIYHVDTKALGFLGLVVLALLFFLKTHRTAEVYPVNEAAQANRIIAFKYTPASGRGILEARLRSGERLKGEYRLVVRQDSPTEEDTVYRLEQNNQSLAGDYRRLIDITKGARESTNKLYTGELVGDRGTRMVCEYFFTPLGNDGIGACKSSDGGRYRIVF